MTKQAAEKIIRDQDFMPWAQVEQAKRILGYDVDAEKKAEQDELEALRNKLGL